MENVNLMGYRVAACRFDEAAAWSIEAMRDPLPKLLVTINPEIIVQAETNPLLREALLSADLTVPDGIGVMWAAKRSGKELLERVPGVDLMMTLLEQGGSDLRVYFLGAKPGVAERAAQEAQRRFGTVIAGTQHGYFKRPDDVPAIVQAIADSKPHLLLAGLGEGQELFLHTHRQALNVPLMIGVGGGLDILSGEVVLTPQWIRTLGLEWAVRVGFDRKRWHRFPRLIKFMQLVESCKRQGAL